MWWFLPLFLSKTLCHESLFHSIRTFSIPRCVVLTNFYQWLTSEPTCYMTLPGPLAVFFSDASWVKVGMYLLWSLILLKTELNKTCHGFLWKERLKCQKPQTVLFNVHMNKAWGLWIPLWNDNRPGAMPNLTSVLSAQTWTTTKKWNWTKIKTHTSNSDTCACTSLPVPLPQMINTHPPIPGQYFCLFVWILHGTKARARNSYVFSMCESKHCWQDSPSVTLNWDWREKTCTSNLGI